MADIEKMIDYAKSQWHKVQYSMGAQRIGPKYLDCSSFVYYCLINGGFLEKNSPIGNTESLYSLKGSVLKEIYTYSNVKRGDIFITGYQGYSSGKYGHTGIFLKKDEIIHCNSLNNTVTINNNSSYISYFLNRRRSSFERYFRPVTNFENKAYKKIKDENWKAICLASCNVRQAPSLDSKIVAVYKKGSTIYYDSIYEGCGYRWISYIARSGKRRFVAYKKINGKSWMKL